MEKYASVCYDIYIYIYYISFFKLPFTVISQLQKFPSFSSLPLAWHMRIPSSQSWSRQEACFNLEEAKSEMAAISGRDASSFKACNDSNSLAGYVYMYIYIL